MRSTPYTLHTLRKGLAVLEALAASERGVTLTELARSLGESQTVVFRLLRTLEASGYVQQEPEVRRWTLGLRVFELGARAAGRMRLLEIARPVLTWLTRLTGQTSALVVLREHDVLYVDIVEGSEPLRFYAEPGARAPAYATASGKVLLAWHPERVAGVVQAGLRPLTETTITDAHELERRLEDVRGTGVSINLGERRDDIAAVAAPVFDARGECVAAVSISGPRTRFTDEDLPDLTRHVHKAAEELSMKLGHRASTHPFQEERPR
jgi:DNA-binding IclR family transcriptional regulator